MTDTTDVGEAPRPGASLPGEPLLVVDRLATWFRTARGVLHAVDGVSLTLARGETIGIVGESGSGKSVLARTIMQLLPPRALTAGNVLFEGRELNGLSREESGKLWGKEIAMVFQNPMTSLNPVMKVGRQITEVLDLHLAMDSEAARDRAIELLTLVGIPEPAKRLRQHPHELSGGMRQRVCLAMTIACNPKLLLADEPTTALDVTIQRQILDLLVELQSVNNMAMILITHDLGVVAGRTNRIAVMYAGQIVETGPTRVLFKEMRHPYTAALLGSIPRLEHRSHTRLAIIPGRPVDVIDPKPGCRFAPRCLYAQPRCVSEDPVLTAGTRPDHAFACFYPVGTPEAAAALTVNRAAGRTAAGLQLAGDGAAA